MTDNLKKYIDHAWDTSILPVLMEYIHIPNKSPAFDPLWKENGFMDKAVQLLVSWTKKQEIKGMHIEVLELPGRTPIIFMDIPGQLDETVLLYGHLDKQPEMSGWEMDLEPWKAVLKGDKLYGRGGADDGYSTFAAVTAIKALQHHHMQHPRCVILIEAGEESGSVDLPFYMDRLSDNIGIPSLVICLDSGCGNYDQMWMTTSLRGLVSGILRIDVLTQGIHSGYGSGVVPSAFMVLRQLLDRIEENMTGMVHLDALQVEIPLERRVQAEVAATALDASLCDVYPFKNETLPMTSTYSELILNRTWRAALSVTGIEGLPLLKDAGNVTLPYVAAKISMRLPPTCDAGTAAEALKETLEKTPPFNAHVTFEIEDKASGWNAPIESSRLVDTVKEASIQFFGNEPAYIGEGGSIPFMGMLGKKFPEAQFLITGVLGPHSNAHGPNEFLHIPTVKKLTGCIAYVLGNCANVSNIALR